MVQQCIPRSVDDWLWVIKLLSLPVVCMEGANLSAHCCKLLEVQ